MKSRDSELTSIGSSLITHSHVLRHHCKLGRHCRFSANRMLRWQGDISVPFRCEHCTYAIFPGESLRRCRGEMDQSSSLWTQNLHCILKDRISGSTIFVVRLSQTCNGVIIFIRSDELPPCGKLHKYQRCIWRGARATPFRDPCVHVIYGWFAGNTNEQPVPGAIRKTFNVGNKSYDRIRWMWRWYKGFVNACNRGRVITVAIDRMLRRDVPVFCVEAVVYCERDHVNARYGMIQAGLALYSGFMDTISICGLPLSL